MFGSFLKALKIAGLKHRYKQTFDALDKEMLLEQLHALREKLNRPLHVKDIVVARKNGKLSSPYHFQRAFGSIPKAIGAAGAGRKKYSRQEMIEILRQIDAKLDRPVRASDVDKMFRIGMGPSLIAIEREFGGLAKARHAAAVKNMGIPGFKWI